MARPCTFLSPPKKCTFPPPTHHSPTMEPTAYGLVEPQLMGQCTVLICQRKCTRAGSRQGLAQGQGTGAGLMWSGGSLSSLIPQSQSTLVPARPHLCVRRAPPSRGLARGEHRTDSRLLSFLQHEVDTRLLHLRGIEAKNIRFQGGFESAMGCDRAWLSAGWPACLSAPILIQGSQLLEEI